MAPWFSASAVAPVLAARWGLGAAGAAWLPDPGALGVGAAAPVTLGGAGRIVALGARCRRWERVGGRGPGAGGPARRTPRGARAPVHVARRAPDPARPRAHAREPRLPRTHVGAVRDVDVDGRVHRGERAGARGRRGGRRPPRPADVRRRGGRRGRGLAGRAVRGPVGAPRRGER